MNREEIDEEAIRNLMEYANSKEMKRFKLIQVTDHITLFQDLNRFETPHMDISHSFDDEHNWLIHVGLLFWSIEIGWNGRKESWGFLGKFLYTLVGLLLIWALIMAIMQCVAYIERGWFFTIDLKVSTGVGILTVAVSIANKLRKMLKNL